MENKKANEEFDNPIDVDKVAENPGLLPYAHHVGSAVIKPEDKGKIKGRALAAMQQQTEQQLKQIYGQIQTLAEQAKAIQKRAEVSMDIYSAQMGFEPLVGHTYHLYENEEGVKQLSMIAPNEWGRSPKKPIHLASVKLLADHTWEVIS